MEGLPPRHPPPSDPIHLLHLYRQPGPSNASVHLRKKVSTQGMSPPSLPRPINAPDTRWSGVPTGPIGRDRGRLTSSIILGYTCSTLLFLFLFSPFSLFTFFSFHLFVFFLFLFSPFLSGLCTSQLCINNPNFSINFSQVFVVL